jgi:CHAT domain-containing protein
VQILVADIIVSVSTYRIVILFETKQATLNPSPKNYKPYSKTWNMVLFLPMFKYFCYLLFILIAYCCNNKAETDTYLQKSFSLSELHLDTILQMLDSVKDKKTIRKFFLEKKQISNKSLAEVKWNIQLADTLYNIGLDSVALKIYDAVFLQEQLSADSAKREMARASCYKKGMKTYGDEERIAFENYFTIKPERSICIDKNDMRVANYLGENYLRIGDKKKCRIFLEKAFTYNEKSPLKEQWYGPYLAISNFLNQTEQYDSAATIARKGLTIPTIDAIGKAYLSAVLSQTLLSSKKYKEAETTAYEALQLLQNSKQKIPDKAFEIRGIYADALQAEKLYDKAIQQYYLTIAEGFELNNGSDKFREFSKLYKDFGDCYYKNGKPDSAMHYYHKALTCVVKTDAEKIFSLPDEQYFYPENSIQEALDAKADWWLKSNLPDKLTQALKALELATTVDDLLQQQFSFDASKLDYQQQKKNRSAKAIGICFQLYKNDNKQEWISKAWAFSEAAKAAVLRDAIKQQIDYQQSAADTLVQQIIKLQQEQSVIKKEQFSTTDTAALQMLQLDYNTTETEYVSLITKLKNSNPAAATLLDTLTGKNILQNPLFANIPLVEFFAADSCYYIFSKNENEKLRLDSCTLPDLEIRNWLSFFETAEACNKQPAAFKQQAYLIYQKLLQPILETKTGEPVIIIPDNILWQVPWDALVTKKDSSKNWRQMPFLINTTTVTLGFSLESLVQQYERKQEATTACIAAFAPVFANAERGQKPLSFSLKEIEETEKKKPCGKYFTNSNATLSAFKKQVGHAEILHISTHALSGQTEEKCQLQFYDSTLYLHELYLKPVHAKLAVLSACETSLGKFENGEGVYNMARGFYMAGAKNVITSLWQVNDESTAALFTNFYSENAAPYTMLRNAKLQYLNENAGGNTSPYYWAAFVNTGYTPTITSVNKNLWIIAAIAAALFIALLYTLLKKRFQKSATTQYQ